MNKPSYCPEHQSKWKLGTYRKPRNAENHASLPGPCGAVIVLYSNLDELETDAEKLCVEENLSSIQCAGSPREPENLPNGR